MRNWMVVCGLAMLAVGCAHKAVRDTDCQQRIDECLARCEENDSPVAKDFSDKDPQLMQTSDCEQDCVENECER